MLKYFKGDVIKAFESGEYDFLLHQANCFCRFGSGIAKQIKEFFPEAYAADMKTTAGDCFKLGSYTCGHTRYGAVVNLYGQFNYGYDGKKYTRLDALEGAITQLVEDLDTPSKVCLPKIGCGLGGADWDTEIVPILERTLLEEGWVVHVYEL